jgi:transcriptional regulator with XRE-family HTH domain
MGHPLKRYRERRQLSQDELAKLLGVTKATISRWESGLRAPRRRDIPQLAAKTGLTPSELLGFTKEAAR